MAGRFRSPFLLLSMICFLLFSAGQSMGQTITPHINGDAVQLSCNCYRLTEAANAQGGSVWLPDQISLNDPFDYTFDVYLGDVDGNGADGIAFLLQTLGTAAGTTGGGIGYDGISPSVGIEVDTWYNGQADSLTQDHMAIQANGVLDHTGVFNLGGPATALAGGLNIEDDQTHVMRVVWNPSTLTLDAYMDGSLRVSYTGDMVADYFGGDPMVFWGFTGSTGGANNRQEFCFSIIPEPTADITTICEGEEILFGDNSFSTLGDVVSWDWDFGNGQTSTDENPGLITFDQPGTYTVSQTIVDAVGCDASEELVIQVDPNPAADLSATEVCEGEVTLFNDLSTIGSGTVTQWDWNLGDGTTATTNSTSNTYGNAGDHDVILLVTSDLGCVDSIEITVSVFEVPVAEATSSATALEGSFETGLLPGEQADWIFADTTFTDLSMFNYTFPDSGWYYFTLTVTNENGCVDVLEDSIYIEGIPEYEVFVAFSPNGDQINEYFQPYTYAMIEAKMDIYNRWGRPVYKYDGVIPTIGSWGWNGTINGKADAAAGTYYYVVDLLGIDGNNYSEHGYVTLIR